ncbi:MAG TPA: 50S ribosomal protein L24 [Candidatus Limnocylindrales bacterium]|nr:50S ribosomal protein L24 [Candidatus Limnocylindrales bacterium]
MKIKKGDKVRVIAGRDKGKEGVVLAAYPKLDKLLVEGINRVTKHEKIQTNQRGSKSGGIVTKEAPIHVSNVAYVEEGLPIRVGYKIGEDGRKVRISRKTGKELD